MKRLRHYLEYVGLKSALFILDHISLERALSMACRTADLYFLFAAHRRHVAINNILRSNIAPNAAEARALAKASFRHFAMLVVESLKTGELFNEHNWREKVELQIPDATMKMLSDPGKGVILVSGHLGNWEIAAQLLSYIKPVVGITRRMDNPLTEPVYQQRKPRNRFRLTPKHDADTGRFFSALKNGEILALLIDQHASLHGEMIDFFGMPASTHTSAALLHLVTKAPICFGCCLRTGPMQYKLVASEPIIFKPTGNRKQDVRLILEKLNSLLEAAIKTSPDQYLWAHRRWKAPRKKQRELADDAI